MEEMDAFIMMLCLSPLWYI